MTEANTIPVFPLNAHIFPGGRMRLRIFEPRYLRMVKDNVSREPAFAMAMLGPRNDSGSYDVLPRVTLVKVIDFESLPGGLLGITIEGMACAVINNVVVEDDGLRLADYHLVSGWPRLDDVTSHEVFAEAFEDMLGEYPLLAELYPDLPDDDLVWYLLRWLEILPLTSEIKQEMLAEDDGGKALTTIRNILQRSRDPDAPDVRI